MALFNRKKKTDVPEEIQEYYQTERRERAGIAWLLAFGTLIVTILLAAGIFFAGRWVYRQIAGNDDGNGTTEVTQEEGRPEEQPVQPGGQSEAERQEAAKKTEEEKRKAEEERQRAARQEAERQAQQGQVSSTATEQRPAAGNGRIPNTGPGDTAAIFLAVSVLGYFSHRVYVSRQRN